MGKETFPKISNRPGTCTWNSHECITLKVESFAGRNFRNFANFSVVRESLYPRNRSFQIIRESLYPQNFLKFEDSRMFIPAKFVNQAIRES